MRICPQCNTPYTDDTPKCARDGLSLVTLNDARKTSTQAPQNDLIGAVVGNYRLTSRLGTGGMGSVYKATHISVGKEVAVKIIKEEESQNQNLVERFYREARAIAKISHENVIQLLDFGSTPEGRLYLVVELLVGKSLAELLTEEPVLSVPRAIHIASQIAQGLGAAHQQKIVHRDLKPENIFLTQFRSDPDFVKVLDFGIAKELVEDLPPSAQSVTDPGKFIGTPLYMAPEQSTDIDHRSDIYALGLILYRMVTGQIAFVSNNLADLIYKHITEPPKPPRSLNPAIPQALEDVILRALEKTKAKRFQSMEELVSALSKVSSLEGAAVPPVVTTPPVEGGKLSLTTLSGSNGEKPSASSRRSSLWVAAVVVLLVGAGAAVAAPYLFSGAPSVVAAPHGQATSTPTAPVSAPVVEAKASPASAPTSEPAALVEPASAPVSEPTLKQPTAKAKPKEIKKKKKFSDTGDSGL